MNFSYLVNELKAKSNLKETFMIQIGSTWTIDSLYIFMHFPLAVCGFLLNFISFRTFASIEFRRKKSYQNYLKVYTLTTTVLCLLAMFKFLTMSPRYFDFALSSLASFYRCVITTWVSSSLYYFINILDCILLFERISNLTNDYSRIKSFFKYDSYVICFILFFMCNLINLPTFFFVNGRSESDYEQAMWPANLDKLQSFTYCYREPFFSTVFGRLIIILIVLLRDILTLLFEISLSFFSYVLFKLYLRKQKQDCQIKYIKPRTELTNLNHETIKTDKLNFEATTNNRQIIIIDNSSINPEQKIEITLARAKIYNARLTRITIYLSIVSIFAHTSIAISYVSVTFDKKSLFVHIAMLTSSIVVLIKFSCHFFLFYGFNKKFRNNLKCC